ncbi:AAA family ATPase [Cereibacter ovatus]|uniref:AAA family ATPase n=1 Tax=Cereibacter ovatus TaxID=439529 RepID=UPI002E2770E1
MWLPRRAAATSSPIGPSFGRRREMGRIENPGALAGAAGANGKSSKRDDAAGCGRVQGGAFFPASALASLSVPERQWLVRDLVPSRNVTLLYGDGGTGKSLLSTASAHPLGKSLESFQLSCWKISFLYELPRCATVSALTEPMLIGDRPCRSKPSPPLPPSPPPCMASSCTTCSTRSGSTRTCLWNWTP